MKRETMSDSIDLSEKLATFSEHWSPRAVAQFNDCDVMVVKVKGEFVWHKHDDTDDFFVVPKGVEHRPVAREEVHLLLMEPTGTPNTGDADTAALRKTA